MTRSSLARNRRYAAICVALFFTACSMPMLADPIGYTTFASTSYYPLSGSGPVSMTTPNVTGSSSVQYSETNQYNGFSLSTTGSAAAERGVLHASASYVLTPSTICPSCAAPTQYIWGTLSASNYEEYGVSAVDLGSPGLLPLIAGYEITFNYDGSISGSYNGDATFLSVDAFQGLTDSQSSQFLVSSSSGKVTLEIGPANPTAPFDLLFHLGARAYSEPNVPGAPSSAYVDFPIPQPCHPFRQSIQTATSFLACFLNPAMGQSWVQLLSPRRLSFSALESLGWWALAAAV